MKRFLIFLVAALFGSGAAWAGCVLEYNTASQTVMIPVFQDSNGANAGDLAGNLTITAGEVWISKNGADHVAKSETTAPVEDNDIPGHYLVTLNATDTNARGYLGIVIEDGANTSSEVPVFCTVYDNNAYDTLFGTDTLQADVTEWTGNAVATTTTNGVPEVDVTYWEGELVPEATGTGIPQVDAAYVSADTTTADNLQTMTANMLEVYSTNFATAYDAVANAWATNFSDVIGTLDAAEIGADAITEAKIADNAIAAEHIAASAIGASEIATDAIGALEIAAAAITSSEIGTLNSGDLGVGVFAANSITNAAVANDVQVDVVTIETLDATDQLDTAANTVTVTSIGAGVIDSTAVGTLTGGDIGVGAFAANSITDAAVANDVQVDVLTIETVDATDQLDSAAGGLTPIATGTAQAATATTLQLASAETFADNELIGAVALVTGGTLGVGQTKCITDYTGSTDTATVSTWTTTPTGTITYEIVPSVGDLCPDATADVVTDVWAESTRTLTAIDEDSTTLDLDATTIGTVTTATTATTASTCTALGANAVNDASTNLTETLNCDMVAISTSATAANNLELSTLTMLPGTVAATAASTTVFYSDDITEADPDHFNGRIVFFTSGALQYQATDITSYALVTGEGQFTVTALTEAPANNDTFIIL